MFRGMDMNGKKMSGEMTGEITGENTAEKMTDENPAAGKVNRKKKFPIGWFFLVAVVSLFLGHFWNYVPVVRGIVGLFAVSKFFLGMAGGHLLL